MNQKTNIFDIQILDDKERPWTDKMDIGVTLLRSVIEHAALRWIDPTFVQEGESLFWIVEDRQLAFYKDSTDGPMMLTRTGLGSFEQTRMESTPEGMESLVRCWKWLLG